MCVVLHADHANCTLYTLCFTTAATRLMVQCSGARAAAVAAAKAPSTVVGRTEAEARLAAIADEEEAAAAAFAVRPDQVLS
jgi:poly-gamma-glutamate capsule biosynthesis protein CapA/YwtB (metallophosphatase superfamily)